jgi:hypothetical protein
MLRKTKTNIDINRKKIKRERKIKRKRKKERKN